MLNRFPPAFFVTGTDTDVGKSVICALLMAGLDAVYWKPVQSGLAEGTDTDWIKRVTGLAPSRFMTETWRLTKPMSPHAAAEHDGVRIDLSDFRTPATGDASHLIVEGAGGVLVPLNDRHLMLDLIRHLNLPVLLVARSTLGTINHTLLSLDRLRQAGIEVFSVVLNGPKNESNRQAIKHFGKVSVWAEIETLPEIGPHQLSETFHRCFGAFQVQPGKR
ncbi:MAG: dethiobiotin synthase [Thermodesulfobacteriota bacterium]